MKRYKRILFCTAGPTKNAGSVKSYFILNTEDFIAFHFYPSYTNVQTYFEKYHEGKLITTKTLSIYHGNNKLLKNAFDFMFFAYVLLFIAKRGSYIITNAPIYCVINSVFSTIRGFRYVLWIGDYYPDHSFPMNLYHLLVDFYNKTLDYVLYLSPPLKKIYLKKRKKDKYSDLVSLGIERRSNFRPKLSRRSIRVGFIGIIRKQQGLDLFYEYLRNADNCILEIVGEGYLLSYYKELAKKLGIQKKVKFYGRIEDVSKIFGKWNIGIALYEEKDDNLSVYCEPTKIKDYLMYDLPVITTRTTYFHKEISKYSAGVVIDETTKSLEDAIKQITSNYEEYLDGVERLARQYDYKKIYREKFSFLS